LAENFEEKFLSFCGLFRMHDMILTQHGTLHSSACCNSFIVVVDCAE